MKSFEFDLPEGLKDEGKESLLSALEGFGQVTVQGKLLQVKFSTNNSTEIEQTIVQIRQIITTFFQLNEKVPSQILLDCRLKKVPGPKGILPALIEKKDIIQHAPGLFTTGGFFLKVQKQIDARLLQFVTSLGAEEVDFPLLVSIKPLRRTRILDNYPHIMNFVSPVKNNYEDMKSIASATKENRSISPFLEEPQLICRSANCLHSYMNLADSILSLDMSYTTVGKNFRKENPSDLSFDRMREFTVREAIFIGSESFVENKIRRYQNFLIELMQVGDLQGVLQTASDLFFADQINSLGFYQKAQQTKLELRLSCPELEKTISVASLNFHQNYFSESFNIRQNENSLAFSGCVGVGLERLTYCLFSQYGLDLEKWPRPLLQFLGLNSVYGV